MKITCCVFPDTPGLNRDFKAEALCRVGTSQGMPGRVTTTEPPESLSALPPPVPGSHSAYLQLPGHPQPASHPALCAQLRFSHQAMKPASRALWPEAHTGIRSQDHIRHLPVPEFMDRRQGTVFLQVTSSFACLSETLVASRTVPVPIQMQDILEFVGLPASPRSQKMLRAAWVKNKPCPPHFFSPKM